MDNNMNYDIIEKAICKRVAIYKAIDMLPPIETKDLWEENKYTKQNQNNLKLEEKDSYVTMNETKNDSMKNDWRDITDPKLRMKAYKKAYRIANKDKIKDYAKSYYEDNKNVLKSKMEVYRKTNSHKQKVYNKSYYEVNKEKIKKSTTNYGKTHRDKINKRLKNRIKTDIQYKLRRILRSRLYDSLKGNYKSGSAVKDLGCTIDELKTYLESKFQPGMTWDNHGLHGWHLDHIKPVSLFDLTKREQFLEAFHYTNLQPLWAKDNLTKSNKVIPQSHSDLLL